VRKFYLSITLAAALAQPVMAADITGQVQNLTIGDKALAFQMSGSSLWFGIPMNSGNATAYAVLVTLRAESGALTLVRYNDVVFYPCVNGAPAPAPIAGECNQIELIR
jgi:hypothetical protein